MDGTKETIADEELLRRFGAGDARAFEALYDRYRRQIFTFIVRSTRDRAAAEELTQEVFLRVVQRADDFKGQSKFSTWLYSITRNLCIDHSRKMAFRRHRSLDAPLRTDETGGASLGDRVASDDLAPDRNVESNTMRSRMEAALAAVPEEQREVFLMRQVEHLSFAEIALVVGVPENTVKSRMRYALERLQKALAEFEDNVAEAG
ncbi:MAG: RNA polymerase sigma factor [Polyangiales bacterium]|nr:RNA polymerase sigma factor [Myxococcales bacterium]